MRSTSRPLLVLFGLLAIAAGPGRLAHACHTYDHVVMLEHAGHDVPTRVKELLASKPLDRTVFDYAPLGFTPCVDGMAGIYPCSNVDLLAALPATSMGGTAQTTGNDIWGWTDPVTGHEWALVGLSNGTSFVDVTDPVNPTYVARLPTQTINSTWRDIKVYADHAFIVADNANNHGIQVFDLTKLRDVAVPPVVYNTTTDLEAHYTGVGSVHNIAINEETGFAYPVGSSTCGGGGLHMVNIQDPANPTFAGCFSEDGYTHDTQCVVYHGPDVEHQGDEICFASNGFSAELAIVDVTDKAAPVRLSEMGYAGSAFTHQGWLSEDHRFFVHDDELDELDFGHNTRTYVWDLADLENPIVVDHFESTMPAIDHNQYVHEGFTYQSNYRAGLRILELVDPAAGVLAEVGFFDTYPSSNSPDFSGTWSNYPYFASGIVVVNDINSGLFVVQPHLPNQLFEDGFESGDTAAWDVTTN